MVDSPFTNCRRTCLFHRWLGIGDNSGSGVLIQGRESIETMDLYETSIPLGSLATVFQTELHIIEHAAEWLLNNGYE